MKGIRIIVMMGEEKGVKPVILKLGLALALSFAGFIYSSLRTRRIKPRKTLPARRPSGHGNDTGSGEVIGAAIGSFNSVSEGNYSYTTQEEISINRMISNNSPIGLSPKSKHNEEKHEFLLPEFNDLVKKVGFGATTDGNSLKDDVEAPRPKVGSSIIAYASPEKDDYEQEVRELRNMVRMLQEREQSLEVQLLECRGLREQETAVRELQNRLKISNMEAKMFSLKVQTLQSENCRLKEQVADHRKVLDELEATKAKIKLLQKKIKLEAERNREQIITLKQRVAMLQEQEWKAVACDQDIQLKLQKLKDLESEVEELRQSNLRLQMENSDLAQRLDSTQILANAVLEEPEVDALKEEGKHLRQENDRLVKEIEQLQADRCSDVEELVYMRWINACLRYELRNYQPPPGKTVAKDLSRSLSPTSEKKAKQLILEYANNDGDGSIVDFNLEQWSSSQGSSLTDSGEYDDFFSVDNSSAARTNTTGKTKIFCKLRRLLHGKDSYHHHSQVSPREKSGPQEDSHSPHFWMSTSTGHDASADGHSSEFATPAVTSRTSFDFSMLTSMKERDRRNSDSFFMGSSSKFSPREGASDSLRTEKSNLEKYAKALKDSNASARQQRRRRSASYS